MENFSLIMLITAALFLAMILQLAAKPKFAAKVTGSCMVIAGLGGLLIYGCGFYCGNENILLVIIRTLLAVCGIYVGKIDYEIVENIPFFQDEWGQLCFYLVHLLALYATASAAITIVGGEALQKLRLLFARHGELNLIYGINEKSLEFGKALLNEKKCAVVFVDKTPDSSSISAITKAGGAVRYDDNALKATPKFLRAIGIRPGSRKVTLYPMHSDPSENLPYAKAFLQALEERGIRAEQTSLVIPAAEDGIVSRMQAVGEKKGYGFVTCYREPELAARLLIRTYPPCNTIEFDELYRAKNNFNAMLIGFGKTGQAVLHQLIMNGQFVGSSFHAHIFDPACVTANGYFDTVSEELHKHYHITFHDCNAHSKAFYEQILTIVPTLNYVVVSAGSDQNNREIAEDLSAFFLRMNLELPIYICAHSGISCCTTDGTFTKTQGLYHPNVISTHDLDLVAMEVNASYQKDKSKTPLEHWMNCDYFSRMSCRATADFVPAFLRAAGKTEEEALSGHWSFSEEQEGILGETEHLRWIAFHHCMGFTAMTEEEFNSRAEEYLIEKQTNPDVKNNIRKNMVQRTHACLIPWDKLDDYSRKENAVTGGDKNYRNEDIKNIRLIPTLIRCSREHT